MLILAAASRIDAAAETEVETWIETGIAAPVAPALDTTFSAQLKLDEDMSRVRSVLPQVELGYRVTRWLALSGGYRLVYERTKRDDFEIGHRAYTGGQAVFAPSRLRLKYRVRLQDEWERARDGELQNELTLRNLAGLAYKASSWLRFSASGEHFLALDEGSGHATRKWRLTAGPEVEAGPTELEVFYRLDVDGEGSPRTLTHIVGLGVLAAPWE